MDVKANIKNFMEPRSVALIGVSSKVGKGALNVLQNLIHIGFKGKIFPVNPNINELLGQKVFPDITSISEDIDLAVVMTPRHIVPKVVERCSSKGIPSVLIITQGFIEADEEGRALQSRIDEIVRGTGVSVLGPNSIGVINHFIPFTTSFIPTKKEENPIGFISQSGGFLEGFSQFKIGKGIDLGNTCDIDFADALSYFEDDPQIHIIGLYVESIKNGEKFLEAAKRVARKKLILVLKAGKSEAGAKMAQSHSGSLAGEDFIYDAVFKQAGLIRVRSVEEFGDISRAFLTLPPVKGTRIGIVTPTGAGGIVALDNFQEYGFKLATFSEDLAEQLKTFFLPWQKVTNPLDIMSAAMAHGYKKVFTKALESLFQDDHVNAIFCILGEPTLKTVMEVTRRYQTKPVVSWVIGQSTDSTRGNMLTVSYPNPERGLRSLAALIERQAFLMKKAGEQKTFVVDRERVKKILETAKKNNQGVLGTEAFSILSAYGIPVASFKVVKTKEQALKAAKGLGYPVVLKVCSSEISHKSDINGVRIGIRDSRELKFHYEDMMTGVFHRTSNTKVEGVIVQQMVTEGVELILGAKRNAQFGPVVVFGWGGVYTELLKDFSCGIPPLSPEDVERMISSTKVSKLLDGFRGAPSADRLFLEGCILRLSQLVSEFPEIVELDINPLKVFSKGGVAIDVRAVIA
jgi:Acyl-CoA synthetase (NDP forming)